MFFKGRKPEGWKSRSLDDFELYSIILDRKVRDVENMDVLSFRAVYLLRVAAARVLPLVVRRAIKRYWPSVALASSLVP